MRKLLFPFLVACLGVLSSCSKNLDLAERTYRCESNEECPAQQVCDRASGDEQIGICVVSRERPDASDSSSDSADGDQGSDVISDATDSEDACTPLDEAEICARDGKDCGTYAADDGCGSTVSLATRHPLSELSGTGSVRTFPLDCVSSSAMSHSLPTPRMPHWNLGHRAHSNRLH
jgi:hypothetical protein